MAALQHIHICSDNEEASQPWSHIVPHGDSPTLVLTVSSVKCIIVYIDHICSCRDSTSVGGSSPLLRVRSSTLRISSQFELYCMISSKTYLKMGVIQFIMQFEDLYLWKDPLTSGLVFGSVYVALLSLCYFSLISVVSYMSLLLLLGVVAVKVGVYVAVTFMKKDVSNPILKYSGVDLTVSSDKVISLAKTMTDKFNATVTELRRLFLVDCMADSIKFGLGLWLLTYIGKWFNMMTLVILAWMGLFALPKIYANNKAAIDPLLNKALAKVNEVKSKVETAIPGMAAKATEIKKEE